MTHDYNGIGSIEDLQQAAREAAGYADFGGDGYCEGLRVLLESYERDADLTPPHGKIIARKMIIAALAGAGERGRIHRISRACGRSDRASDLRGRIDANR